MSDQDPIEPPQFKTPDEPDPKKGRVGVGISLAILIVVGSWIVFPAILIQFHGPIGVTLASFFAWVILIPAAAIMARSRGYVLTAKGLWIGLALLVGILLLVFAICGIH